MSLRHFITGLMMLALLLVAGPSTYAQSGSVEVRSDISVSSDTEDDSENTEDSDEDEEAGDEAEDENRDEDSSSDHMSPGRAHAQERAEIRAEFRARIEDGVNVREAALELRDDIEENMNEFRASIRERVDALHASIRARFEARHENLAERKEEIKERLLEKREEVRLKLEVNAQVRVENYLEKIFNRFDAFVGKIETTHDRIETKLAEYEALGADIETAAEAFAEAEIKLDLAKEDVASAKAAAETEVTSETSKEEMRALVEAAKESLEEAKTATLAAVRELKVIFENITIEARADVEVDAS